MKLQNLFEGNINLSANQIDAITNLINAELESNSQDAEIWIEILRTLNKNKLANEWEETLEDN